MGCCNSGYTAIPGYEGIYEISNVGDIRSIDRTFQGYNGFYHLKGKNLRPTTHICNGRKYLAVNLSRNGIVKSERVHRLMADSFLPKDSNRTYVNHINGDSLNNAISNLERCSQRENVSHGRKGKGTSKYIGVRFVKSRSKWAASVWLNGKNHPVGNTFLSEEQAHLAYKVKLVELGIQNMYAI